MTVPDFIQNIKSQEQHLLDQVIAWSNINSGSHNLSGLNKMAQACTAVLQKLGATVDLLPSEEMDILDGAGNAKKRKLGPIVRASKRPNANRQVLLVGHMDTVFPDDSHFQSCTLAGDGNLYGPGTADMKGGITVMIAALEAFEKSTYAEQIGWTVLLNSDEEIGSHGSARYLKEYAQKCDLGMLYEPSMPDGTFAGARKGSGNFTLTVKGKAAHAGREHHLGRNAIAALCSLVSEIDALTGQRKDLTVNVGKISGGGPLNVVPELAQMSFNVRLAHQNDQAWLLEKLDQLVEILQDKPGYEVALHGGFSRPPKEMTKSLKAFFDLATDCGKDLGIAVQHVATGGCCDGNNLANAGLVNIDTLGVRGANIHSDKEYMIIESLVERAQLSALILHRLAQSPDLFPVRGQE